MSCTTDFAEELDLIWLSLNMFAMTKDILILLYETSFALQQGNSESSQTPLSVFGKQSGIISTLQERQRNGHSGMASFEILLSRGLTSTTVLADEYLTRFALIQEADVRSLIALLRSGKLFAGQVTRCLLSYK